MTVDLILFLGLAFIAVGAAACMLISRSAIYSALFLVLNFITIAVLYLALNAAFIALVQVTVYAGAIMVLFLFVIMLLGAERLEKSRRMPWQRPVALILGAALIAEVAIMLFIRQPSLGQAFQAVTSGFGSPRAVGELLFDKYLIPFEVTSILLLAAMVGAILLTRHERKENQ
jgi:NADH-quinone oxidoreductase subunit J